MPSPPAVAEDEVEVEGEVGDSENGNEGAEGIERGHRNLDRDQNQTFNKKPLHKRVPMHKFQEENQLWRQGMQHYVLTNINDSDLMP